MNWKFWQRDEQIRPGDMVVIVKDCCGHWLGRMFIVGKTFNAASLRCNKCQWKGDNTASCEVTEYSGAMVYMNLSWLKKIKPLNGETPEQYWEKITRPAKEPA